MHLGSWRGSPAAGNRSFAALLVFAAASATWAEESQLPAGEEIARRIDARGRGQAVARTARLELIDSRGRSRLRQLRSFWKRQPDARHLVFFVVAPPEMRRDAFLVYDYFDSSRDDDQFIYKSSRKQVQRIAAPRRGDPFLGSDFTLEDMKKEDRVEVGEYAWKTLAEDAVDGQPVYVLEQVPGSPELARNLGFARAVNYVDRELWMRRRIEFWDLDSKKLKTIEVREIGEADGIWTARRIEATNHQSGHRSILHFEDIDYASPLDDELFTVRFLRKEVLK